MDLVKQLTSGDYGNWRNDDDGADRLNYRVTVAVLVTMAIAITTKTYVGDPITCWCPAHFSGNWEDYSNAYCWVRNTYYLPFSEHIPKIHEHHKRDTLTYYQWVPIILLFQALIFYLPCVVWRTLIAGSGLDLNNLVETSEYLTRHEYVMGDEQMRSALGYMTKTLDRYLRIWKKEDDDSSMGTRKRERKDATVSVSSAIARSLFFCCGRRSGNYIIVAYMASKVVYVVNSVSQLFLLSAFLGSRYYLYGIDVAHAMYTGSDWMSSARFPRVTMCDMMIRRLGNLQRYTLQCVLPINLYNEKVFLVLWFWLVLVAAITVYSFFKWIVILSMKTDNHRFVKRYLANKIPRQDGKWSKEDKARVYKFVQNYLRPDGIFVLRIVLENTDDITTGEFVGSLWDHYILSKGELEPLT